MFKKINHKLLSRFPLLWNTKIFVFLPAAFLIHFLFYLAGLANPIEITELHKYSLFRFEEVILFSVLVSILLIIIWLVYFLRNNPFKSYYTLSKKYMFAEYFILFIVFLSSSTFFLTYKQGFYDNINLKTKDVNLKNETDIFNLSFHFIAYQERDFDTRFRCDSVEIRAMRDSIWNAQNETTKRNESDLSSGYTEEASQTYQRPQEGYLHDDSTDFPKSYLNYCQSNKVSLYAENGEEMTANELNKVAEQWLTKYQKDSVLQTLSQLKNICTKYGVINRFNPEKQTKECFGDSLFSVNNYFTIYDNYEKYGQTNYSNYKDISGDFISTSQLESSLERIDKIRHGFWDGEIFLAMFLYALGASIFLFSFRISRLRTWFISIVSAGVLSIIISLISVFGGFGETGVMQLLLFLWIVFLISAFSMIKNKNNKLLSGIFFQWSLWFTAFVVPLIFALIEEYTKVDCYSYIDAYKICPDPPFIHTWINRSWLIINSANIIVVFLAILLVFIPLSRKWQSNPEE